MTSRNIAEKPGQYEYAGAELVGSPTNETVLALDEEMIADKTAIADNSISRADTENSGGGGGGGGGG